MNPVVHTFPCNIGDKVTDSITGIAGVISGLIVWSGGDQGAAITYVVEGRPQVEWVPVSRLRAAD